MANPLPDGYLDVGAQSIVVAGSVSVLETLTINASGAVVAYVTGASNIETMWDAINGSPDYIGGTFQGGLSGTFPGWSVRAYGEQPAVMAPGYYAVILTIPGLFYPVGLTTRIADPPSDATAGPYSFSETLTDVRLGRRRILNPDLVDTPAPIFDQAHMIEQYHWFGDWATKRVGTCNGNNQTLWLQSTGVWETTQSVTDFTPIALGTLTGALEFTAHTQATLGLGHQVDFGGLSAGGSLDTTGLTDNNLLIGTGGGSAYAEYTGSSTSIDGEGNALAVTSLRRVLKPSLFYQTESSREDAIATVADAQSSLPDVTTPYDEVEIYQNDDWSGTTPPGGIGPLTVSEVTWNGSMQPHPSDDAILGIWCNPGNTSPITWPVFQRPVTVQFDHVQVNGSAGDWVDTDPLVTVLTLGAVGTNLPEWRPWLGVGTLGHAAGAFNPDLSQRTKHSTGNVWGWGSHGYLELGYIKGGDLGEAADVVTMRVHGVLLSITDPHTTGSDRPDNYVCDQEVYYVDYRVETGQPGLRLVTVDLMLPRALNGVTLAAGGREWHHGRVDKVELISSDGRPVMLQGIVATLKARGSVYLKVGYAAPVQHGDYSNLGLSNGGSAAMLATGDNTYCEPEDEVMDEGTNPQVLTGGNLRYVNILTGAVTEEILDSQHSLSTLIGILNQIEGVTATYDSAVFDADNEDAYGVSLGGLSAQSLVPSIPDQVFALATPYQPECHYLSHAVYITNGVPYILGTLQCVGAAVSGLVQSNDSTGRAPASVEMQAAGYAGSVRNCDAYGYVRCYPVEQSTTSPIGLEQVDL